MRLVFFILFVVVASCRSFEIASYSGENLRISEYQADEHLDLDTMIIPFRQNMSAIMEEVIGSFAHELTIEKPESTLGNWMADALLSQGLALDETVDFAVQNYGGVRIKSMSQGDIKVGDIYEVMPFDNFMVILNGDSSQVQIFFDHMAESGGWPVSHSVNYRIEEGKALDISINNERLRADRIYKFVVPDYVANGGSDCFFLKELDRVESKLLIRDALINEVRNSTAKGMVLKAELDGRVKDNSNNE